MKEAAALYHEFEKEKIERIREGMRQEEEKGKSDIYKTPEYQAYIERITAPLAPSKLTPESKLV